jgi:ankyrin repeat protein
LHIAAQKGHIDIIKFLLQKGASVDATDDKENTVLHYACYNIASNSKEVFEFFIDSGVNPDKVNLIQCTLLHVATRSNNRLLVAYLVDKYPAMINAKTEKLTALHLSVISNYTDIFKIIIENQSFRSDTIIEDIDDLLNIARQKANQYMIKKLASIKN